MEDLSNTDLATQQNQQVADTANEVPTILAILGTAAANPNMNVATMAQLHVILKEAHADEAKVAFNAAMTRINEFDLRVKKNGTVDLTKKGEDPGTNKRSYKFATWDDMDAVIRPILRPEGMHLWFDTVERPNGGGLIVTGHLEHSKGHSRSASIPLALDTGPGRNNLQAMGSTLSYGKRYTTEMLLNIVRENEDDDGKLGGTKFITDDQSAELLSLMKQAGRDEVSLLERMTQGEVRSVQELQQQGYVMVKNTLGQIIAQQAKKGQS